MKTWQALLITLGTAIGASFIPSLKIPDETKVALGTAAATIITVVNKKNSETDPNGNELKPHVEGGFISKPQN